MSDFVWLCMVSVHLVGLIGGGHLLVKGLSVGVAQDAHAVEVIKPRRGLLLELVGVLQDVGHSDHCTKDVLSTTWALQTVLSATVAA